MSMSFILFALPLLSTLAPNYRVELPPVRQQGLSSFYGAGEKGMHGTHTATGEKFIPSDHTCASRTLPLHSWVVLENPKTGKWVYCRINDRGPFGAHMSEEAGGGWAAMIKRKGMYEVLRRIEGVWQPSEFYTKKPGKYRGIMDMSYGTAKALGVDLNRGLNRIRIRYWKKAKYGMSPKVYMLPTPPPKICFKDPLVCSESL